MNHYPIRIKTQCEGSLAISTRRVFNEGELKFELEVVLRGYHVHNISGDRLRLNWWFIREEDDVVIAQSKGFKP